MSPPKEWSPSMCGLLSNERFYSTPFDYFDREGVEEEEVVLFEAEPVGGHLDAESILSAHDEERGNWGSDLNWSPGTEAMLELQRFLDEWAEKYPAPGWYQEGERVIIRASQWVRP